MAKRKRAASKRLQATGNPDGRSCYSIHLISGATGNILYRLAAVAATQFSGVSIELVPHTLIDSIEKLRQTLNSISGPKLIVIHALAELRAKQLVRSHCVEQQIPHFDVTGPLIDFLADCVGRLPDNDVSRLHRVDDAYQQRIEAMEFALEHDDGLGLSTLREADIVIVGISRVSKSPTTLYLGARGYKTANVSIARATGFPKELSRILRKKVVALTMQPKRLCEIRRERMKRAGAADTDYEELGSVIREVMDSEAAYRKRGYPIVDVTNQTIEQTAVQILEVLKLAHR